MDYMRIALAANLNRAADTLERLATRVEADLTKQESLEEMQAEVEAGAAVWGAINAGFLAVPEIVEEVEGLAGNGYTEPNTWLDNGVHCANLFFAVMR